MTLKNKIKVIMKSSKLATISTINQTNGKPQSALIAFVENGNLELFFQTSSKTRKYQNLMSNKQVALIIGFGWTNLQYEGIAEQVNNINEKEDIKQLFADKNSPTTRHYLDLSETVIFKVRPQWIGYRDYNKHPPEIAELRF